MKQQIKNIILFLIQCLETYEYRSIRLDENDHTKKIINSLAVKGKLVATDTKDAEITQVHLTQPYHVYKIETESKKQLECADLHILFDKSMQEVFCKDLSVGSLIQTKDGVEKIASIEKSKYKVSMFDISLNDANHRYYTNDILSHNTITSSIFIAWYVCFHYDRNVLVIANKMATTTEIVDKIKTVIKNVPFFLKPGSLSLGATGMKFDNGVKLYSQATTKTAALGFTIHLLYADEFAHIDEHIVVPFYRSIYPTLSSSQVSRIIISSTPNQMNLFYEIYAKAMEGKNEYFPIRVDWWQVPGRDEKWRQKEINNLGSEELFNQEYGNQFLASSRMLLSSQILQYLKRTTKEFKWKEVDELEDLNDNYAELTWHPNFDPNEIDVDKDRFVFAVDLSDGVGSDSTVINIMKLELQSNAMIRKITEYSNESSFYRLRQVGMYRSNLHSIDDVAKILEALIFNVFHEDIVRIVLEINFKGNVIIEKLSKHKDYYPEIFMHTFHSVASQIFRPGVKIKADNKEMFSRELRNLIKNKRIVVTEKNTFNELGAFGLNKQGRYEAQTGHDDIAMTLINLVAYFDSAAFEEMVEETYDTQQELVKKVIYDKINADVGDTVEKASHLSWLRDFM
ncbi:MAG: terminase family protein [Candidatus Pacearchaeota archaeon]|jgi:hypothetical protein|nr:terminase family protein [Clostridia bacterium]